jgi:hypothetical protein
MFHFVYNSYEAWGRNYIGVHSTDNLDDGYLGSSRDPTFSPKEKDILEFFETREEAKAAEITLHEFFDVENNPLFANLKNAGSMKFDHGRDVLASFSSKQLRLYGSKGGKSKSDKKLDAARSNGKKGAPKISKPVLVTNLETGVSFECYSCREAARQTGLHLPWVYELAKGRRESRNNWAITYVV